MLSGCTEKKNDVEIDVCTDDCILDDSEIEDMRLVYKEKVSDLMENIAPNNLGDVAILSSGNYYPREEISRIDPITGNWDIPIFHPVNELDRVQFNLYMLVSTCEKNTNCDFHTMLGIALKEVEYGYTENNGYYSFKGYNEDDDLHTIEYGKFNFDGGYGNFEQFVYFPALNHFSYSYFTEGKYYSYDYYDNKYEYLYIDIEEQETIYIDSSNDGRDVAVTNDGQILYKYFEKFNHYEVMQFDDLEFVSSLSKTDHEYESNLNFHFVDGWDTLYKERITGPGIYDKLYNNDVEVFSEYSIFSHSLGVRYYVVNARTRIDESQLSTFSYPATFTGSLSFAEMKEEFDFITSLNDPFELLDMTEEELITDFEDYLQEFIDKYNIEVE
jgi:hypothetical protein